MGKVYLAKSGKDGKLFRARVQDLNPLTARVQFIDYGDVTDIEYSDLFLAQHLDSTAARLRPLVSFFKIVTHVSCLPSLSGH